MRRLPTFAALAALTLGLLACTSEAEERAARRIEDLPADQLQIMDPSGPRNVEAGELLDGLPFEPSYPDDSIGARELLSVALYPSPFGPDSTNPRVELWMEYRGKGGESDWVTITQTSAPMPGISGAETEVVDVAGVEGVLVDLPRTDAIQLVWHACDRTLTITSHVLTPEEAVEVAESMTEECP